MAFYSFCWIKWHSIPFVGSNGVLIEEYFIIEGNYGVLGEFCELIPLGSNCSSSFSGDTKYNLKKNKFSIGPRLNQIIFDIDVPPHINSNGGWECTLTERVYIKL